MSNERVLDLSWSPKRIKDFCENNDNWVLLLEPGMTTADVETLYRKQVTISAPYEGLIAEIASDPRTPRWVLEDIGSRFEASIEVMGALATNPAAPEAVLERLQQHQHPIVREHAEQTRRGARNKPSTTSPTTPPIS